MPEPKPREGATPKPQKKKAAAQTSAKPAEDRVARFNYRDKNHNGVIDHDEFMSTLAGTDKAAGEARFKKLDTNNDGGITKEEFLANGAKAK